MGWVSRDSTGSLIGAGCSQVYKCRSIKLMEAKAIIEGLYALIICVAVLVEFV